MLPNLSIDLIIYIFFITFITFTFIVCLFWFFAKVLKWLTTMLDHVGDNGLVPIVNHDESAD